MPNIKLNDRVKEKSYSTGTGPILLEGKFSGFSSFSGVYNSGEALFYAVSDGTRYEVGSGLYIETSTSSSITRLPFSTSNDSDAIVDFPVGLKEVYVTYPGKYSVFSSSGNRPNASGVAFWDSEHAMTYDSSFVWNSSTNKLGINQTDPQYAVDVGGNNQSSTVRSSGFIVGDSGVMFSGVSPLYSGGRQLEPFMRNQVDNTTGSDDIIALSGMVSQVINLKKQPPSTVFAGPSGECGCVSDYPVFRPLRFNDINGVDQIINSSGRLVVPVYNTVQNVITNITSDQTGAIAFAKNDSFIMIANGTSWVSGQLI
tara:strand:- start:3421 stop:4359 length:939 start_codon:yes stop_codon:yes gene_type:complete